MLRTLDSLIAGHGRKFVLARFIGPAQRFASIEASGGIVLLVAMVAALLWVNSPWDESYFDFWHAELALDGYFFTIEEDLGHLVNDGLMVIFFFVVGLEIKRELVHGELSSPKKAALPVAAAIGGMAAPAAIYSLLNVGGDGAKGWGIPVATDIAFAMGVLTLLGARAPVALKVFLLALAIADDLGGILIIAVFYTDEIALEPVLWGALVFAVVLVVNRAGVRSINLYVVLGALFWVAVLKSGIHATVAGVLLAFLTPSQPYYGREQLRDAFNALRARYAEAEERGDHDAMEHAVRGIEDLAAGSESPLDRLEHALHPWTSYAIVPIFALANAGVVLSADAIADAASSRITLGVFLGLVVGKPLGVLATCFVFVRLGWAQLPGAVDFRHLVGAGLLAGIGMTVSLFITGLAFSDPDLTDQAKIGILAASTIAGIIGFVYLWVLPGEPGLDPAEPGRVARARAREAATSAGGN